MSLCPRFFCVIIIFSFKVQLERINLGQLQLIRRQLWFLSWAVPGEPMTKKVGWKVVFIKNNKLPIEYFYNTVVTGMKTMNKKINMETYFCFISSPDIWLVSYCHRFVSIVIVCYKIFQNPLKSWSFLACLLSKLYPLIEKKPNWPFKITKKNMPENRISEKKRSYLQFLHELLDCV